MKSLIAPVLWLMCVTPAHTDDGEFGKEQIEKWGAYYANRAADYDLRPADDDTPLTFHERPVLRWSNPVISNGSTHGECFLWTKEGRPEAFASIFSYRPSRSTDQSKRTVAHVFNTFSTEALVVGHRNENVWNVAGRDQAEFLAIADAPKPAVSRTARLVQMRRLAREFSATSGGTGADEKLALRLLPQPVYRNDQESAAVLDGALFVFVTGTDPELLLTIEARRGDGDARWTALVTRHSHLTLRLEHKGVETWRFVRGETPNRQSYLSQHGVDVQSAILP